MKKVRHLVNVVFDAVDVIARQVEDVVNVVLRLWVFNITWKTNLSLAVWYLLWPGDHYGPFNVCQMHRCRNKLAPYFVNHNHTILDKYTSLLRNP